MQEIIKIEDGIARQTQYRLKTPINLTLNSGEHWAIIGDNGSGKTLLVGILTGLYPLFKSDIKYNFYPNESSKVYENILYLSFRDSYGESDSSYYYQQRWNSMDRDLSPLVKELIPESPNSNLAKNIYEIFEIEKILNKEIILLSSGELRKFQLTKALLSNPRVLIIDNPFIGLDVKTRAQLTDLFTQLSKVDNLQIIVVLSKVNEVPKFVTHIVELKNLCCSNKIPFIKYIKENEASLDKDSQLDKEIVFPAPITTDTPKKDESNSIVLFKDTTIKYGEHIILKDINWEIKKGEKWALSGQNGSGKSTLLSLICADNPQGYACNISLFGRKRGTGESIWDIKKRIGYVSPEMHRAYLQYVPTIEVVCSGLFDTVGLYTKANEAEIEHCTKWMDIFGIKELKENNFMHLSSGEQRLALLARAFVKDPDLIILDEPLHGLDNKNSQLVLNIIEEFCNRADKTLIMVTHYKDELPKCITNNIHLIKQ